MKSTSRQIEVWADWAALGEPKKLGTLSATPARGKEIFAFEYDRAWLSDGPALALDPALELYRGKHYVPSGHENFGVFLDSCPDRWGRVLMRRREAQVARETGRSARALLESDYLLGVFDHHRMGALRFRTEPGGAFLDDSRERESPPWTSLRELEQASLALEREGAERDPRYSEWLRMLMAPGASLGGARPKADVVDPDGRLWIAKFPSASDAIDVGAWEHVVQRLAERAGVVTSPAQSKVLASKRHTFLTMRFDRDAAGRRLHFASAMTLLGRRDGEGAVDGASYLDLADLIVQRGTAPARDLEQLWRRIVLFVCVSNVDDHLRNHGFMLRADGWELAPAYDMNPIEGGTGLALNISEDDNALELELVLEVAPLFRVKAARAAEIVDDVVRAVRRWRTVARDVGLAAAEQDRMAGAFRVADAR